MPYLQSSPKPKAWNAGSNLKPKNIWKGEPYQTIVKISRKFPPLLSTFSLSLLLWSCEKGARASLDKLGRRLTLDNAPLLRSEPPLFSFYPLYLSSFMQFNTLNLKPKSDSIPKPKTRCKGVPHQTIAKP